MSMNIDKSLEAIFPKSSIAWEHYLKNYLMLSIITIVAVLLANPTSTVFVGAKNVFNGTLSFAFIAYVLLQKSRKDLYPKLLRLTVFSGLAVFLANIVKPNDNTLVHKAIDISQTVGFGLFQGSLLSMAFVL